MFRPCIDLHQGKVKQIVGGTLSDNQPEQTATNFESERPSSWFAELYKKDGLTGGHVIQLGPGNEIAARAALEAYPGGLQIGGGITLTMRNSFSGRELVSVIATPMGFPRGQIDRLIGRLVKRVGRERVSWI